MGRLLWLIFLAHQSFLDIWETVEMFQKHLPFSNFCWSKQVYLMEQNTDCREMLSSPLEGCVLFALDLCKWKLCGSLSPPFKHCLFRNASVGKMRWIAVRFEKVFLEWAGTLVPTVTHRGTVNRTGTLLKVCHPEIVKIIKPLSFAMSERSKIWYGLVPDNVNLSLFPGISPYTGLDPE